jgi:heptosyltransferase-3
MREPKSILLIAIRQIGDVLLVTPLLRTLRKGYPHVQIDVLVYRNKGGMLEGNRDCDRIIEVSEHPALVEYRKFLPSIFRKYDLAVNTLAGDRPHLYAFWAARARVGVATEKASFWKPWINQKAVLLDNENTHTVLQNLKLGAELGLPLAYRVIPPASKGAGVRLDRLLPFGLKERHYAVLHPYPMWRYKRWTEEGWSSLVTELLKRFDCVVITGGPNQEEEKFAARLVDRTPERIFSLVGKTSFPEAAELLRSAQLYVGPDTAMTHLAASCGTPTVAIYGPSNPVKWGPWPYQYQASNPWGRLSRSFQKSGNVLLLQGAQPKDREACVPCAEEGCERNKESHSACLDQLPVSDVLAAVRALLGDQLVVLSTEIKAE